MPEAIRNITPESIRSERRQAIETKKPMEIYGRGTEFGFGEMPQEAPAPEEAPEPTRQDQIDFIDSEIKNLRGPYEKQLKAKEEVEARAVKYKMGNVELQQTLAEMGLDKVKEPKIPEYLNKARIDLIGPEEEEQPFGAVSAKDYTSESVKAFQEAGGEDYSLLEPRGKAPRTGAKGRRLPSAEQTSAEQSLRKEFQALPTVKDYGTFKRASGMMERAWDRYEGGGDKKSLGVVDQALITLFNKMTDPTSVVRESEYARTPENVGIVERLLARPEKWMRGGAGIGPQEREALIEISREFMQNATGLYNTQAARYRRIGESGGLDLDNIARLGHELQEAPDFGEFTDTIKAANPGKDISRDKLKEMYNKQFGVI